MSPRVIVKRCNCGRSYTREEWLLLPSRGMQDMGDNFPRAELRNCICTTTLVLDEPEISLELVSRVSTNPSPLVKKD